MTEEAARTLIIDALHKVKSGLNNSSLALRLQDPGADIPLAELGMDSLDVVEWCMEIEAKSGIELDPADLSTHDSLAELVRLVAGRKPAAAAAIDSPHLPRATRGAPLPLSFVQERIWLYSRNPKGAAAYVLRMADHIRGPLDAAVLRDCLGDIVRRHEILRTSFAVVNGQPAAIIRPAQPVGLPVIPLAPGEDIEDAAARIARAEAANLSDLTQQPLIRFALIRIAEHEHRLLRICHHILWDGWSTNVFLAGLARLYEARLAGTPLPLPETEPVQYADYAAAQRNMLRRDGPAYRDAIQWWKARLPEGLRFQLPFKRDAPASGLSPADGHMVFPIETSLVQRLNDLRRETGATPYGVWLAALAAVLAGETAQPDVVIGTYMTNRRGAELQNMIGCFANLVPLHLRVREAMAFGQWLLDVRMAVAEAEAHSDIPYDEIREQLHRLGAAAPEITAIFGAPMGHRRADTHFAGLTVSRPTASRGAAMPWGFTIDLDERDNNQRLRVSFDAALYDPAGVRRFIDRLFAFLDAVSHRPDRKISEALRGAMPAASAAEKDRAAAPDAG